ALRAAAREERPLDGVELAALGDALDRPDLGALRVERGNEAAVDERAVDDDRARAALALAAPLLRPRELELLAEHVEEPRHGMRADRHRAAVHGETQLLNHG